MKSFIRHNASLFTGIALVIFLMLVLALKSNPEEADNKAKDISTSKIVVLDSQNFDRYIREGITLVYFSATWCGPCRIQSPILENLAGETGNKAVIAKLDIDSNSGIAGKYSITAVPTLLIFKDGTLMKRLVGLQNRENILDALNSLN